MTDLHLFCNDKDQWEVRDKNSGELLAWFECDDDSMVWLESAMFSIEEERDEALAKIKELESALDFIHDMAYEDLRTAQNTTSTWTIEAIAAKALGLSDEQRDVGVNADDKLAGLIAHIAQKCDDEVAEMWNAWQREFFKDSEGE